MKKFEKVKTKETFQCGTHYRVEVDEVVRPNGDPGVYSVVRIKPFSVIIPIDSEGRITMVRQHRYATDSVTLEFPLGNTDGQDPFAAAKRELEEEVGLESDDWVELGRIQEANGIAEIIGHLYLARQARKVLSPVLDPADKDMLDQVKFSVDEVRRMIANGEIEETATICAFARAEMLGLLKK